MKNFKESEQYQEMLSEIEMNEYLNEPFNFICSTDGFLLFSSIRKSEGLYDKVNICIKTKSDVFNGFSADELINCENIEYFDYQFCEKVPEAKDWTVVESINFSCYE